MLTEMSLRNYYDVNVRCTSTLGPQLFTLLEFVGTMESEGRPRQRK